MKKNVPVELGIKIKEIRELRGLSQLELAQRMSKSVGTVSNFERGETIPSVLTLSTLAKALNVKIRDFFDDSPTTKTDKSLSFIEARLQMMSDDDKEILAMIADGLCKIRRKKV